MDGADNLNDAEVMRKMEDEHLRLQRQVKMIQTDRLHRTVGVHPQFKRQDELLKRLKREYVSLCKDLKIARSGAHKKKDKKMKFDLKSALMKRVQIEDDCEGNLISSMQINNLISRNYTEHLELRKLSMTTQGELTERQQQSELRLMSAENKLETATLRFNVLQHENKQIREQIEHMLKDRQLFNQSWDKMLTALSKGKKFLFDLFESSTLAYDQRDEWCGKLRAMQEKGKVDQMLQVQEMRDLIKAYDHEMKLYQFYYTKGISRVNKKQEEREEEQKRIDEEETRKLIEYHIKLLRDITEYTGKSTEMQVIQQVVKVESENFAMYRCMSEFCAENEILWRDVQRIRQNAVDRRDENERLEEMRQAKINNLRQQLEKQQKNTEELRRKNEEKIQFIDNTMKTITEMFSTLDCPLEPFQNLLGDKRPSVHQLHLTMTLITEKIKEYKELVCYYERCIQKKSQYSTSRLKKYTVQPDPPEYFAPAPITTLVPADPCPSCVQTRWFSRIADEPETPFDYKSALIALKELAEDPAYISSDRIHLLTDCKVPRSRAILARRYVNM